MAERRVTVVLKGQLLKAFDDFRFDTRAESLAEAGERLFKEDRVFACQVNELRPTTPK